MLFTIRAPILRLPNDTKLFEALIGYGVKFGFHSENSDMLLPTSEGRVNLNVKDDLLAFAESVGKDNLYGVTLFPADGRSHEFLLGLYSGLTEEEKNILKPSPLSPIIFA